MEAHHTHGGFIFEVLRSFFTRAPLIEVLKGAFCTRVPLIEVLKGRFFCSRPTYGDSKRPRPTYRGSKRYDSSGKKRPTYRGVPISEVPLIEVVSHTKHRAFCRCRKKRPTYRGVPLSEVPLIEVRL